MKRFLPVLAAAALGVGLCGTAQARVFVDVGIGVPFQPAFPVYGAPLAYYPPPPPPRIVYAPPPPPVVVGPPPPPVVGYYPRRYYYPVY